jgi:hypothetical protein
MNAFHRHLFISCLVSFLTANAQNSVQYRCCDDGSSQGDYWNHQTTVYNIYNNCVNEIVITARDCVDRTRDRLICGASPGSKYCCEDSLNPYPRYYALSHPIIASPSSLTFTAQYGGGNPSPQTFSIMNGVWAAFQIDNTLNWSASKTQNWLTVSPSSGSVSGTTPVSITVSVNVAGLATGTYSDIITVSATQVSNTQYERIQITLNITSSLSASISGPTYLSCNQAGTWTASVSGGSSPYHYQWYYYIPCNTSLQTSVDDIEPLLPPCGSWFQAGADNSTFSHSACSDFEVKCVVHDALNNYATSNIVYVTVGGAANFAAKSANQGVILAQDISNEYSLSQNYPNPFNPSTEIRFTLLQATHVKLVVYDMLGRKIAGLADEQMNAGYHSLTWNASDVSSGIYIYRLSTGNFVEVKRMVVMK